MFSNPKFIIKTLSSFLVFTIIVQIILGAWVRLTDQVCHVQTGHYVMVFFSN